jgi:hypothetical protein
MLRRVPGRKSDRMAACLCGAFVLACAGAVWAQSENPPPTDTVARSPTGEPLPQATDGLKRMPADAFRPAPEFGVRYRTLFRGTGAPYTDEIRPVHLEASAAVDNVEARVHLGLPNFRGRFPLLDRGFAPEDADIKIGPVYFKLHALSAGVLGSDNVNHEEKDPEADVISIVRVGGTLTAQLTEGVRIATSGSFVWLPTKGQFGVSGYGLFAPYTLGLEGIPALESEVSWDTMIAGWNVLFADDFRLSLGRFSTTDRDDVELFEGGQFDQSDTAGRYSFRSPRPRMKHDRFQREDTDVNISYLSNVVSVTTERLAPGPVRLKVRAYHEDLWYNQGNRGGPSLRDSEDFVRSRNGLTFHALSERDNLRFNPFLFGRVTETDRSEGFNEEIRLGLSGPITDQLHLSANAGLFHRDESGSTRFVWGVQLRHLAGPYTRESIIAGANYGEFTEEFTTHFTYRLRQVIGPKNVAEAYISLANVEDLRDGSLSRDELRTGVRDSWYVGPRTTLRGALLYSMLTHGSELAARETYALQLELNYHFTDTFFSRLLLEHRTRHSDTDGQSYDENLFFLTLTKHFD